MCLGGKSLHLTLLSTVIAPTARDGAFTLSQLQTHALCFLAQGSPLKAISLSNPPAARGCPSSACRLRPCEHSSRPPAPDRLGRAMDKHDSDLRLPYPLPPLVPAAMAFYDHVHYLDSNRSGT